MILGAVVVTAAVATAPLCCLAAGNEICDDEGAEEAGAAILGCSEGQRVARATRGDRLLPQRRAPGTSDRTQVFSVGSADASRRLGEEQANGIWPGGAVLFLSFFFTFFFFPCCSSVLSDVYLALRVERWSRSGPGGARPARRASPRHASRRVWHRTQYILFCRGASRTCSRACCALGRRMASVNDLVFPFVSPQITVIHRLSGTCIVDSAGSSSG